MSNPDSIALAALAEKQGLEAVLVGGNAVNLHAYSRTTFDLDLLVPERDAAKWLSFFEEHGYAVFHRTVNFIRLRLALDPAGALPVDLMLSDEATFQKIKSDSTRRDLGSGAALAIPSVLHLIAMKLHALRSPGRIEHGLDLQDVAHLIKSAKIDTGSREFTEILERHGTDEIRRRIREISG
jgi:hypothetical protein